MVLLSLLIIIRPHRSTTYVDAACCYRPSSVVRRSVVCVWLEHSGGPREPCIRWGSRSHRRGNF